MPLLSGHQRRMKKTSPTGNVRSVSVLLTSLQFSETIDRMTGRASSLEKAVPLISNGSLPEEAEEES